MPSRRGVAGRSTLLHDDRLSSTDLLAITDSNHVGLDDSVDDVRSLEVANSLC